MTLDKAKNDKTKYADISAAYKTCDTITTPEEVETLTGMVNNAAGTYAMVDYPYAANLIAPLPAYPVKAACESFSKLKFGTSTDKEVWAATADSIHMLFPLTTDKKCLDIKKQMSVEATFTDHDGWNYMDCNEMIMPQN